MFEINYSQLIQYEILEKLVTYISDMRFRTSQHEEQHDKSYVIKLTGVQNSAWKLQTEVQHRL